MTPEPLGFDPELEGLLRELAADPRSQLLRRTRPRTTAGLLERAGPVSPARAGLTAAERHLLEVHRDELADVLRRACLMRFYSDPDRALYLNRSRDARHAIDFDTPQRWRQRAREALADARRSPRPLEGLDLLEACLRDEPGRPVAIADLARASLRLQPTDVAEAYVGLDLVLSGDERQGITSLGEIVEQTSSRHVLACSLENIGLAHGLLGNDPAALSYYRQSARVDEKRPAPVFAWLVCSLTTSDRQCMIEAAGRLDDLIGPDHSAVEHFINCKRAQARQGRLRISEDARNNARATRLTEGSASWRIIHALS